MGPPFTSRRGRSDSIAPRDWLAHWESGDERFPPPLTRSVHAGGKSQPSDTVIQNPWWVGRWVGPGSNTAAVSRSQSKKSTSFMQKTHQTVPVLRVCAQIPSIHPLIHSPMVTPHHTDTEQEYKNSGERQRKKAEEKR